MYILLVEFIIVCFISYVLVSLFFINISVLVIFVDLSCNVTTMSNFESSLNSLATKFIILVLLYVIIVLSLLNCWFLLSYI